MHAEKAVQLAVLAATGVWLCELPGSEAATELKLKLCGRKLSDFMSKVCQAYNSPPWESSSADGTLVRKKRQLGIADQCCRVGCTWEQLTDYCAISAHAEPPFDDIEAHLIEDRSAERRHAPGAAAGAAGAEAAVVPRFVVAGHGGGGSTRGEARVSVASRAAPVVGTVSPLLGWGRTLHTDLPPDRQQYAYVALYARPSRT